MQKRADIKKSDTWDLKAIYKDNNEYKKDIKYLNDNLKPLTDFKGHIMDNSESLYNFITLNEKINQTLEKVYVYANLKYYEDMSNNNSQLLKEEVNNLIIKINTLTSFIMPEVLATPYSKVLEYLKNPKLKPYSFDLEKTYRYQKYVLSEKEEHIMSLANNAFGACSEVHDALDDIDIDIGSIKVDNKNIEVTNANYGELLNDKNREVRKKAYNKMLSYFEKHINTFAASYLGEIKENLFNTLARGYASNLEKSLYNDVMTKSAYQNLINTVHKYLPLYQEYLGLRKKMLGLKDLHWYDTYVDLVSLKDDKISYDEAKDTVLKALSPLGKTYINDLSHSFTDGWIDKYPNIGKRSGAFSWGTYGSHPYVLLNFNNTYEDVSTMAHELGHAMHSYYSNKYQTYTYSSYPIILAEIASTVNESLLNEYSYKSAKSKNEKIYYLVDFLDKVKGTIIRQTMFAEFEMIIHDKVQANIPLNANELSNIYYDLNKLYFGSNVKLDRKISNEWARIPHFYTPFYVYKYATGLASALSLTKKVLAGDRKEYLEFLTKGCSEYPLDILKTCGVDLTTSKPIDDVFLMFQEKLTELKKLLKDDVNE